jgi:hypothetical protein
MKEERENDLNTWSTSHFEEIKEWALRQPSPDKEHSNLWDALYSPRKTTEEILKEIENYR